MATAYLNKVLTISDPVQGVAEWAVERRIDSGSGYGAYAALDPYTCPSSPIDEMEVYAFAFQDTLSAPTFAVGYKAQYRFTPTGFDEENGDAWESAEYNVIALVVGAASSLSPSISLTLY